MHATSMLLHGATFDAANMSVVYYRMINNFDCFIRNFAS
jgi:hypothetical protein